MSEDAPIPGSAAAASRPRRFAEMFVLFIVLPLAVHFSGTTAYLPILWLFAVSIFIAARRDPTFPRRTLWNRRALPDHWKPIVTRFLILAPLILLVTWWLTPELLFRLPREKPLLYCMILFGYPWVSVLPQGVIYRAFFLHRYGPLFPRAGTRFIVAAFCFGFLHIIFENPVAIGVTLVGGWLFTRTHERSQSLFVSSVEHAMYGLWLMTSGWGAFLYPGSARNAMEILFG